MAFTVIEIVVFGHGAANALEKLAPPFVPRKNFPLTVVYELAGSKAMSAMP